VNSQQKGPWQRKSRSLDALMASDRGTDVASVGHKGVSDRQSADT
jgi:hypothetical protein